MAIDNVDCTCTVCPNPECDEVPTRTELICQTCDQATEPADYCWGDCPSAAVPEDAEEVAA